MPVLLETNETDAGSIDDIIDNIFRIEEWHFRRPEFHAGVDPVIIYGSTGFNNKRA